MNKFEKYAAGHYLSKFPDDLAFEELLDMLENENNYDDIIIHEHYELFGDEDIAEFICDMAKSLERAFK